MLVHTLKQVEISNAVAEAVYLVFGGIPEASKALGIVSQGVRNTLSEGKVATRANAERWETATELAGCKIPREELIGWAPWCGPERHDMEGSRLGKDRSRSGPSRLPAAAKQADAGAGIAQAPAAPAQRVPATTKRKSAARRNVKSRESCTRPTTHRDVAAPKRRMVVNEY